MSEYTADEMATMLKAWRAPDAPAKAKSELAPARLLADGDTQWQCTICGRVGTVGRCCGTDTRTPLNEAAREEQRRIEAANEKGQP